MIGFGEARRADGLNREPKLAARERKERTAKRRDGERGQTF